MSTLTTAIGRVSLVLVITFLGVGTALAYKLDGIPESGSPYFKNNVKVDFNPNSGKIKISGKKDFLFNNGTDTLMGVKGKYTLKVAFDKKTGAFKEGEFKIKGAIPDLGFKREDLVEGIIIDWNLEGNTETGGSGPLEGGGFDLWGFATSKIQCSPLLLIQCTENESIYIALDDVFSGDFSDYKVNKFRTTGMATTTVPVPAAAWLFGSALGFLAWLRRRKSALKFAGIAQHSG